MNRKTLGDRVVFDSRICHGAPTFRGTRILVADVLEQVARGLTPREIVRQWDSKITEEAVAEAILMARTALLSGETAQPRRRARR